LKAVIARAERMCYYTPRQFGPYIDCRDEFFDKAFEKAQATL